MDLLRAIDLLHNAAFRVGLGNSLFVPKSKIGKISTETLQHYTTCTFQSGQAAVIGLGVGHTELTQYAQELCLPNGEGVTPSSPYKGGELRSNKAGDLAFVAVAGEGACITNTNQALAFAILRGIIGAGPSVQWATTDHGLLGKGLVKAGAGECTATAINASYSGTGIFGILVAAPAKGAAKVVETAVKVLKSGSVTDEDVERGKNLVKTQLLLDNESGSNAILNIGSRTAVTGFPQTAHQLASAVDAITTVDVTSALKQAGQRLTIASIGNLSNVPYADDLK